MKRILFLALLAFTAFTACGVAGQTAQQQQQTAQAIQQMLDQRSYSIDVYYMIPLRGPAKSVTEYSLSVDGDVIDSHLPYVGQAQSAPYGGGKGLNFEETVKSYADKGWKKDCRTIVMDVRNEEDDYVFNLDIFDNGEVSIRVHCNNRDDINFQGRLSMEK